jgi:hypothetical protein
MGNFERVVRAQLSQNYPSIFFGQDTRESKTLATLKIASDRFSNETILTEYSAFWSKHYWSKQGLTRPYRIKLIRSIQPAPLTAQLRWGHHFWTGKNQKSLSS